MKKLLLLIPIFFFNSMLVISSDKNDSLFPIFKEEAIKRGYELPKPYGINVVYVNMKQNVDINSLNLTIGKLSLKTPNKLIALKSKSAKTVNTNVLAKADIWIFPFLNVYGILGKTKGYSSTYIDINLLRKTIFFKLKYEGMTYGIGTVLAGGYKNFFSLVDFNYTKTALNIADGEISALIVSPKIGYKFDVGNSKNYLWVGAMYQNINQTLKGDLSDIVPRVKGKFEVKESTSSPWNPSVGFRTEINKSIELTTELNFGKRKSIIVSLGYRI